MLVIKAKIIFFNPDKDSTNKDGLSTKNILRPAFNFGDDLLFSGTIINDNNYEKYYYQNIYGVVVEFPTIEDEAYKVIQPLIKIGMNLAIQNASRIIGEATLLDYSYKD